jgi:hypothetical protein
VSSLPIVDLIRAVASTDVTVIVSRNTVGIWVAYAAALWAAVFAVFHIIWAAGWYPLLDEGARLAFATPWKWTFDVVVAAMCVIAVPVALAPVMSWGRRAPRRLIYTVACIGTTLLLLRLAGALVQTGYLLAAGRFRFAIVGIWDWWFLVGTILFTLNTWGWSRTRRRQQIVGREAR